MVQAFNQRADLPDDLNYLRAVADSLLVSKFTAEIQEEVRASLARLASAPSTGAWQPIETAPERVAVLIRYKGWISTARLNRYSEDGEGGRFPATSWSILHYNGGILFTGFYGGPDMEWMPLPLAPQPDRET